MNENIYKKMLKPEFKWDAFSYEDLVGLGMDVVDSKKNSHRLLGKLANAVQKRKLADMKSYANEIGISASGLRAYKSVESAFEGIDVPQDLNWGSLLALKQQPKPKKALQDAIEHGLSSAEIIGLYKDKGAKKKIVECPHCHQEMEI